MDKIHPLLLLFGLCSLSSYEIQYEFSQDAKTWYEARTFCREKRGDLVTMYTLDQMQTALQAAGGQFGQGVWIGLYKGTKQEWHWSLALKDFYKEGERNYRKWGAKNYYRCGSFQNGLFYRVECLNEFHAVCFDVTKEGLQQYILSSAKMKWRVAREYCRNHHTDLASVRNEQESQTIQEVVGDLKVWVGLFRDPWEWSYGSKSSFRYWTVDQEVYTNLKMKQCVTVRENGRWEQRDCNQQHRFLCSFERSTASYMHFYKVKISLKEPGLDLNDHRVKEDILKHIKQQLNGTEGVQWRTQPDGNVFRKEEPKEQEDCVF